MEWLLEHALPRPRTARSQSHGLAAWLLERRGAQLANGRGRLSWSHLASEWLLELDYVGGTDYEWSSHIRLRGYWN